MKLRMSMPERCDPRTGRWVELLTTLLGVVLLTGCLAERAPLDMNSQPDRPLGRIHAAMAEAITLARTDPRHEWHSGWWGNLVINTWGGNRVGLCYQWQELIYTAVSPVAQREGWEAVGLTVNEDRRGEHHAVLVYDPRLVGRSELLIRTSDSFVLDAWRAGRAEVYITADWVYNQGRLVSGAKLEDLTPTALAVEVLTRPEQADELGGTR